MKITVKYPQHILEAMEKDKPSKEPSYWARKGCHDCFGKGILGNITRDVGGGNKIVNEQLCSCVRKAFVVWQEKWMIEHEVEQKLPGISVSALSNSLGKTPMEERIERIDELCAGIKEEIRKLNDRKEAFPQEVGLPALEEGVTAARESIEQAHEDIANVLHEADILDSRANELYAEVKTLRHGAEVLRSVDRNNKQLALDRCTSELHQRELSFEKAKGRQAQEQHKILKKIRELEHKLDKLEDRRYKVLKEHGLDPVTIQESTPSI